MIIQHNIGAINTHRQLGINNSQTKRSLERLSSGYRINRAADDAAGLAISEKMRAQVTGLGRASMNAQDGESLVQTAEGALQEVHGMLNRMVELATESANGVFTNNERHKIESELDALRDEIDRISRATNFNGVNLLDGTLDKELRSVTHTFPGGDITGVTIPTSNFMAPYLGAAGGQLDSLPEEFQTQGTGPVAISYSPASPASAATHVVFSVADRNGGDPHEFSVDVASQIRRRNPEDLNITYDVDLSPFGKISIQNSGQADQIGVGYVVRGIAGFMNGLTPGLSVDPTTEYETNMEKVDIEGLILQVGDTAAGYNKIAVKIADVSSEALGIKDMTMETQEGAASSIDDIRGAIDTVSVSRGKLGAVQNRLEYTVNNLGVTTENLTAAESRIRDADMAKEFMNQTKNEILNQSAQSMLAQANQQPQQVLQLLQ